MQNIEKIHKFPIWMENDLTFLFLRVIFSYLERFLVRSETFISVHNGTVDSHLSRTPTTRRGPRKMLFSLKDRSHLLVTALQKAKQSRYWISKMRRSLGIIFGHSIVLMSTSISENMSIRLSLSSEQSSIFDFGSIFFL